jgi:acetolactate synthase-1/2/3 large subunit
MNKISIADYIAKFLAEKKLHTIFAITGASAIRVIDSINQHPDLTYYCPHHEQAGVMAGIGNFRKTGQPGVMVCTAGPGGTNMITGVASAYLDSIPFLAFSGQEKTEFLSNPLRGKGVQGLNLSEVLKPLTKLSIVLKDPKTIKSDLEHAYHEATTGRPGPVWIEVPQDIQTIMIDENSLVGYSAPQKSKSDFSSQVSKTLQLLKSSQRPLIWVGHGVRLAKAEKKFLELVEKLKIPVLTAWNGADLLYEDHPSYVGRAGIYGNRYSNFILQNCDLLIALGTRLAIPQMGYSAEEFASAAKKVVVEIDPTELEKFKFKVDVPVLGCVAEFIDQLNTKVNEDQTTLSVQKWLDYCSGLKKKYPIVTEEEKRPLPNLVNSYHFIDSLSNFLTGNEDVVTDMGTSLTCTHAAIRLKKGNRLITSTGLGEMGFGLPCAMGVGLSSMAEKRKMIFIGAEGSLMMNIQEFQFVAHHKIPMKIFIVNNDAYLTIRHTETALFGPGRLTACTPETGISFPDLGKVAKAFGLEYASISNSSEMNTKIKEVLEMPGPVLCNVFMPKDQFLGPKSAVKVRPDGSLYSPPLEDLAPFLDPAEVKSNMLIERG